MGSHQASCNLDVLSAMCKTICSQFIGRPCAEHANSIRKVLAVSKHFCRTCLLLFIMRTKGLNLKQNGMNQAPIGVLFSTHSGRIISIEKGLPSTIVTHWWSQRQMMDQQDAHEVAAGVMREGCKQWSETCLSERLSQPAVHPCDFSSLNASSDTFTRATPGTRVSDLGVVQHGTTDQP